MVELLYPSQEYTVHTGPLAGHDMWAGIQQGLKLRRIGPTVGDIEHGKIYTVRSMSYEGSAALMHGVGEYYHLSTQTWSPNLAPMVEPSGRRR